MSTLLGKNVEWLMRQHGIKRFTHLAKLTGVPQPTIHRFMSGLHGEPRSSTLKPIADYFGITLAQLLDTDLETGEVMTNVQALTTGVYTAVPLISWVQAGNWAEIVDNYVPGDGELVAARDSKPGKHAFALRVEGDSMVSHNHLSFPPGTIIIVDPSRAPGSGDFVVAKDVSTGCATFKRLMQDAGHWFLKPLNPAYPLIPIDDPAIRVIGVVIESQIINKL